MSYYAKYLQRLIGGTLAISRNKLEPGHIVSFRYRSETTRRRINRLVLILGKFNKGGGMLLHGLNLEHIPHDKLYVFLKRVIIKDTLSLIKRKYEIKGPFSQLIDRPKTFYVKYIKPNLLEYDCYRTYKLYEIKQPKCYMLNWRQLRLFDNTTKKPVLIDKDETLVGVARSRKILNEILKSDIGTLNNARFKKLINERFGSMASFYEILEDLENYSESPNTDPTNDDFNASKT